MRATLIITAFLVAFFSMPWWMPRNWYRALLYGGKRPNALAKRLNAVNAWVSGCGIGPSFLVSLETKGRKSGRISKVPMVVAELGSDRFLVSMLGEKADWVLNARAAGGEADLRFGKVEHVRLEEVPVAQRAPILKVYLARAPGARPHFDIDPDAPVEQFAQVAASYPVFRIRPRQEEQNRVEGKLSLQND